MTLPFACPCTERPPAPIVLFTIAFWFAYWWMVMAASTVLPTIAFPSAELLSENWVTTLAAHTRGGMRG